MTAATIGSAHVRRLLAAGAFAALLGGLAAPALPAAAAGCGYCDDDFDGLTNAQEYGVYYTDLADWDTDGDGRGDGDEVYSYGSNPLVYDGYASGPHADYDHDGLYDIDETQVYGTDPYRYDSDGDGWGDGEEVYYGSSPRDRFCDPYGCG